MSKPSTTSVDNNIAIRKKKGSHNKEVPCKTFVHLQKNCLCCGKKMQRISGDERYLTLKTERIKAYIEIYSCLNKKCDLYGQRLKPMEFNELIFPGLSYGIDIMAEIGILRLKEHKTINDIHSDIISRYPHVEISLRHMQNIINKIMYTMEAVAQDAKLMKKDFLKRIKALKA